MPGFTPGFHEGSRQEYLAQYVFSAFGTASAIPHQEDHGFDLYCTLAQRSGPVAWADKPYSVQVKSDDKPWTLNNRESVEWLVRHPLPLFLCVVDKTRLRMRIYHTTPKYYYWTLNLPLPEKLSLCPGQDPGEGECEFLIENGIASLSAPIGDFTLDELKDNDFFQRVRDVLDSWINLEYDNLFLITSRVRQRAAPYHYKTNVPITEYSKGTVYQSGPIDKRDELQDPIARLRPAVAWVMEQSMRVGDWNGALRAALFLHYFCPDRAYSPSYVSTFCYGLDRKLGITARPYVYATLDAITSRLDAEVSRASDREDQPS